jgi:hypothetical protein
MVKKAPWSKNSVKLGIIDFFEWEGTLSVKTLSPAQKMTLKIIRGEELDTTTPIPITHPYQDREFESELEMFKVFSGKPHYTPTLYSDASLCYGRRSGKSTTLGAGLAIYYATQFDYTPFLGTSPHATIPLISASKEQAGEIYAAIKSFFLRSPYLYEKFLDGEIDRFQEEYSEEDIKRQGKITGGVIKLNNRVIIKVMAADYSKVRGIAVPFAILDEVCFFGVEGNDIKNTDKSIYEALAPALSQFQTVEGMALILKISSPNGQAGLMYEDYENKLDPDVLHLQVPSWYANDTIPVNYLKKQEKKGKQYFSREYGAQYTASETSYLDPDRIDKCIIRGLETRDYCKGYKYVAAMDYATKDDYWAFSIGHKEYYWDSEAKEKKSIVYIDFTAKWRGKAGSELNPAEIIPEICMYMKRYKIGKCITDQYASAALKPFFQKEGCTLQEFMVTTTSKLKYMYSLAVAVNSEALRIVHDQLAIKHLKDLREKRTTGTNKIKIEHAQGCHDDLADTIALCVYQFDKTSPIYVGITVVDDEEPIQTKDLMGKQVLTPTAQDVADYAGNTQFHDNRKEIEEKEKGEPESEDSDGFWFII